MNTKQLYTGIGSLVIAGILALMDLTEISTSLSDTILAEINIYPAAFFALLGLLLIFLSVRSYYRKRM
jgi:hypothetical protein